LADGPLEPREDRPAGRIAHVLGLRRSPVEPVETRSGQPLHPLTVPNLVGYVRIGLLGAFLGLALPSGDGRVTAATICFGFAAGSDYLDGLLARATGQYSRLGALLDPFIDRMLVLSGVIVTWKFELLPRWALGALATREILMVALVAYGLRRGVDVEINWIGRLAVWPTMAGVGGAMIADMDAARICLYVGLAGASVATLLYVRDGLRELGSRAPQGN
jgi:CDP-diacylglycerol--glycerol-3-phosphate 3-phosphatidyltransferase